MKRLVMIFASVVTGVAVTLGPAVGIASAANGQGSATTTAAQSSHADLSLQPTSGRPGSTMVARLACLDSPRTIKAPNVFHLNRIEGAAGSVYYDYTVVTDAQPGRYVVHGTCGNKTLSAIYTVT